MSCQSVSALFAIFSTSYFFNATATTDIYTLSLHDALPIFRLHRYRCSCTGKADARSIDRGCGGRSEEHTSELQSRENLVCRLLLVEKKLIPIYHIIEIKLEENIFDIIYSDNH